MRTQSIEYRVLQRVPKRGGESVREIRPVDGTYVHTYK